MENFLIVSMFIFYFFTGFNVGQLIVNFRIINLIALVCTLLGGLGCKILYDKCTKED